MNEIKKIEIKKYFIFEMKNIKLFLGESTVPEKL